uniref:cytochrome c oxidase subunit 3 n=1 Tax=Daedaleopsis nitida TaxID=1140402 RepID=UPI0030E408C9
MLININRNLFNFVTVYLSTILVKIRFTGLGMLLWFRDIILEATYLGDHTTQVQKGLTMGVILFIVSEVFAFFSVFWAFFHSSLSFEIGGVWPPQMLNEIILDSSILLITGNIKRSLITDSVFSITFYTSTGLHVGTKMAPTKMNIPSNIRTINSSLVLNMNNNNIGNLQGAGAVPPVPFDLKNEISDLAKIKEMSEPMTVLEYLDLSLSKTEESFPWYKDENGNIIEISKYVGTIEAVKYVAQFLRTKYSLSDQSIPFVTMSKILAPFKDNRKITIKELFDHICNVYMEDSASFINQVDAEAKSLSETSHLEDPIIERTSETSHLDDPIITPTDDKSKPFGQLGEINLNQTAVYLRDLKWDSIFYNVGATIHVLPTVMNFFSYSLLMRTYLKYVHHRPYNSNITEKQRVLLQRVRNRQLLFYSIVGAPLAMYILNKGALSLKDKVTFTINPTIDNSNSLETNENTSLNSSVILLLLQLNNKIPNWLKLILKLSLLSILIFKLVGISPIEFIFNVSYLKISSYLLSTLAIFFELFSLYLLHKFSTKKVNIPDVFPNFIINWLKEFELLGSSKESIIDFKYNSYIHICISLSIIIITTIF